MHRLSLRKNFSWNLAGNIVYAGCQWGILVALAKLGSPEMVGRFALGLAITAPIIMFANLQLRGIQATDASGEYQFGDYLGLRLITTLLALVGISAFSITAGYPLPLASVILAIGLSKAFESISDVTYGLFQQQERLDRVGLSLVIRGPASLVAITVGLWLFEDLFFAVMALALSWGIVLLSWDYPNAVQTLVQGSKERVLPHWKGRNLLSLVQLAAPLGLTSGLVSLIPNIPKYFLQGSLGEHGVGYFAAIEYFKVAGITVISAMGQAVSQRLAQHLFNGRIRVFQRLLLRSIGVAVVIGLGGVLVAVLAGQQVLSLLYGAGYSAHEGTFVLIMISAGISYVGWFLNIGMIAQRRFVLQLILYALVAAATAISSYFFVPLSGVHGAAWSTLIGSTVHMVGGLIAVSSGIAREEASAQKTVMLQSEESAHRTRRQNSSLLGR
jgi:O-antigen/teichoic acid export membrane protein